MVEEKRNIPSVAEEKGPGGETPGAEVTEGGLAGEEGALEEARRPTPVRLVMEGSEEGEGESSPESRVFRDGAGDQEWIARIVGRSGSGILPLRTVQLMEVVFSRTEEPERLLRSAICQGEDLMDLSEEEILALLEGSEPYREPGEESDGKEGRRGKGKGRRRPRG